MHQSQRQNLSASGDTDWSFVFWRVGIITKSLHHTACNISGVEADALIIGPVNRSSLLGMRCTLICLETEGCSCWLSVSSISWSEKSTNFNFSSPVPLKLKLISVQVISLLCSENWNLKYCRMLLPTRFLPRKPASRCVSLYNVSCLLVLVVARRMPLIHGHEKVALTCEVSQKCAEEEKPLWNALADFFIFGLTFWAHVCPQ